MTHVSPVFLQQHNQDVQRTNVNLLFQKVLVPCIEGIVCHRCRVDIYRALLDDEDGGRPLDNKELKNRNVFQAVTALRAYFAGTAFKYQPSQQELAEVYREFVSAILNLIGQERTLFEEIPKTYNDAEHLLYMLSNRLHDAEFGHLYPMIHYTTPYLRALSFDYFYQKDLKGGRKTFDPQAFVKHFKDFEEARGAACYRVCKPSSKEIRLKSHDFFASYKECRNQVKIMQQEKALVDFIFRDRNLILLPPEVYQLEHLETLDLSGNYLLTLPPGLSALQKLRKIDLRGSQIKTLPIDELCEMPNLKEIFVAAPPGYGLELDDYTARLRHAGIELTKSPFVWSNCLLESK